MSSSPAQNDADINTARTLQPGIPLSGSLPTGTDRNFFALNLQAGYSYAISITPLTTAIIYSSLVDRSGADATRTVDDYGAPSPLMPNPPNTSASVSVAPGPIGQANVPAVIPFTALITETVYAEVSATYFGGVLVGQAVPATPYIIQLSPPDDYGDTPSTAGQLTIGASVTGTFGVPNDKDKFAVTLEAGKTYEFDPSDHRLSMSLQSAATLQQTAQWNWYDPPFTYTPDITGTYYLTLSTWLDSGSYTIAAKLLSPPQTTQIVPTETTPAQTALDNAPATPPTAIAAITMHRLFDTRDGAHLMTSSTSEADELLASQAGWISEDPGFDAISAQSPGARAVFRFFDTVNGSQFLTISTLERDAIIDRQPRFVFEGIGFDAGAASQNGMAPVYRYFDMTDGTHFYTSVSSEVAAIAATRPELHSEGIAFYAPMH